MSASLTLLICTHNRADLLGAMLSSVGSATCPPDWDIKVLVIANACTDETGQILKKLAQSPFSNGIQLQWAEEPETGKSHALNRGIALVDSDWVVLTDDDHRVQADFLTRIADAIMRHPEGALLCGRILPDWDGSEPGWVHQTGPFQIYPPPIPVFDEGDSEKALSSGGVIPGGGNIVIQTRVLHEVGRFSTHMGPRGHNFGGGEDSEMVLNALRQGYRLIYVPGIVQFHHVDKERLKLSKLVRLSYQRARAITRVKRTARTGVPPYLLKKFSIYFVRLLLSLNDKSKTVFYLVRMAATLGEGRGMVEK